MVDRRYFQILKTVVTIVSDCVWDVIIIEVVPSVIEDGVGKVVGTSVV